MERRPTSRRKLLLGVALLIAAALGLGAMLARVGSQPEPDRSGEGLASALLDTPSFAQDTPAREIPVEVAAPLPDAPLARDGRKPRELRGVVLRSDGSPAAQIDVALFGGDTTKRMPLRKVKADKDGGFVIDEAPLGRSLVCSPPFTWIEAVQAVLVDGVTPPEPLTLRLPPSGTLVGLLVDRNGPAESASQVIAQSVEHPERLSNATWNSAGGFEHPELRSRATGTTEGQFSIANLPAGEWDLYALRSSVPWYPVALNRPANGAPGFASFSEAGETAAHLCLYLGRVRVPVETQEPRFDISAFAPNSVLVHVRRGAVSCPDSMVSLYRVKASGRGCISQYVTHEDGSLQFSNLWAGDYDFEVRLPGSLEVADVKHITLGTGESLALELQAQR